VLHRVVYWSSFSSHKGSTLLCINLDGLNQTVGFGFDDALLYGDLPVRGVENAYDLPVDEQAASGMPPEYESVYFGQLVRDIAGHTPSVPSAREAELAIIKILDTCGGQKDIPRIDIAEAIFEIQSNVVGETIRTQLADRILGSLNDNCSTSTSAEYEALSSLAMWNVASKPADMIDRLMRDSTHGENAVSELATKRLNEFPNGV
jgi:hypothetical protein